MWLAIAHRSPSLIIHPLISSFSLFPPCLSVFTACHFIHPCTCHQPLALRMKWWGALREEERRSNLTPSRCISEAPSAAERRGRMRRRERIEGTGKSCSASRRRMLTFYSRLGSLWHIAILSLARGVQLFIICYFCSFPPAQRCPLKKLCLLLSPLIFKFIFTLSFPSILLPVITLSFCDLWLGSSGSHALKPTLTDVEAVT